MAKAKKTTAAPKTAPEAKTASARKKAPVTKAANRRQRTCSRHPRRRQRLPRQPPPSRSPPAKKTPEIKALKPGGLEKKYLKQGPSAT